MALPKALAEKAQENLPVGPCVEFVASEIRYARPERLCVRSSFEYLLKNICRNGGPTQETVAAVDSLLALVTTTGERT